MARGWGSEPRGIRGPLIFRGVRGASDAGGEEGGGAVHHGPEVRRGGGRVPGTGVIGKPRNPEPFPPSNPLVILRNF